MYRNNCCRNMMGDYDRDDMDCCCCCRNMRDIEPLEDCNYSTAISPYNSRCGLALIARCRILSNDIACLTKRINDLEDYLECHPNDRLAKCILCDLVRKLAGLEAEYAANCQGCPTSCGSTRGVCAGPDPC